MFYTACFTVVLSCLFLYLAEEWFRKRCHMRREMSRKQSGGGPSIAFFHPYCNSGGGGERVLWCAVRAVQKRFPDLKVVVYTGDIDASPSEIISRVQQRLNITLLRNVDFVYLHNRAWVEADRYPYFTLLGQSLGSIVLGMEAMMAFVPDVYIDTMGYAFTLPLFKSVAGCRVGCYVHYPTITRDMLRRVSTRVAAHNNRPFVANSPVLSFAKIIYYRVFAWLYCKAGRYSDIVLVNSSWTEDHINSLWERPLITNRVYPPCDTTSFREIERPDDVDHTKSGSEIRIVSVGQFRPEKDHPLQLKAMYHLRQILSEDVWERTKLVFIGSCRNSEDEVRVKDMKDLCRHLSLENNVEFKVNASFTELKSELSRAMIGLHAMWNEHFGIGVVECMAAGLIVIAHRSGGPKADIIHEEAESSRNGFLAVDEYEYASTIATIVKLPIDTANRVRVAARSSVERFSVAEFEQNFLRLVEPFFG